LQQWSGEQVQGDVTPVRVIRVFEPQPIVRGVCDPDAQLCDVMRLVFIKGKPE